MTYKVVITREDGAWLADVPDVPGAHTYARSLPGLMAAVREVIVLMDDLADDEVPDVELRYDVDDPDLVQALSLAAERDRIAAAESGLQAETAATVHRLVKRGYSVRDIAQVLGITPGRVSQLSNTTAA